MGSLLRQCEELPAGLLEEQPQALLELLGGPTLIHLAGRREQPLFVSVLLHGNETTGVTVLQGLLRELQGREMPRALSLFIGNVTAARDGVRRLAGQPDYNRIWPGTEQPASPERRLMEEVFSIMRERRPFASVDVHNNTGINPHYACINRIDHRFLHLASLFSRTVVYFLRPRGVQSMAFAQLCPAVTVECGKVGHSAGEEHVREFLSACLHLSEIPAHSVAPHDVDLYHTVATVRVPRLFSFGFGDEAVDVCFVADLDHLNFRELPPGTTLAKLNGVSGMPVEAVDEQGQQVAEQFFSVEGDLLRTRRALMPAMLTLDERVIRQDCLGYLMERYSLPA